MGLSVCIVYVKILKHHQITGEEITEEEVVSKLKGALGRETFGRIKKALLRKTSRGRKMEEAMMETMKEELST